MILNNSFIVCIFQIIVLNLSADAGVKSGNIATISGALVEGGIFKFEDGEILSIFISKHGGLPCSEMQYKDYKSGKVVSGIVIYLQRGEEVISLNVKGGKSFFNSLRIVDGDIISIKYNNNMFAKFNCFKKIPIERPDELYAPIKQGQ